MYLHIPVCAYRCTCMQVLCASVWRPKDNLCLLSAVTNGVCWRHPQPGFLNIEPPLHLFFFFFFWDCLTHYPETSWPVNLTDLPVFRLGPGPVFLPWFWSSYRAYQALYPLNPLQFLAITFVYFRAEWVEQWFSTCGSQLLWGCLSVIPHIRYLHCSL